jgi:hypothetical protein
MVILGPVANYKLELILFIVVHASLVMLPMLISKFLPNAINTLLTIFPVLHNLRILHLLLLYLLHFPTLYPILYVTFTRMKSWHCLGTFRAEKFLSVSSIKHAVLIAPYPLYPTST